MAVDKITGWKAPYRSSTFRDIANAQIARNGLLSIAGAVTQVGATITIPAFTAVQNGLIYKKTVSTSVTSPGMTAPYALTVTTPTPTNIDNLVFGFAQNPEDITVDTVVIADYDGYDWRVTPLLSIDGIIKDRAIENIQTGNVGPYDGLRTTIVGSDYSVSAGGLIDRQGDRQTFSVPYVTPVIGGDPDWSRVDKMVYRRPTDSPYRIGTRRLLLGGTYTATPSLLYSTNLLTGVTRHTTKTVIASDNTAHMLCITDAIGSYTLKYTKISSDRQSVLVAELDLITSIDDKSFDVAIDENDVLHIVYQATNNIYYQRASALGVLIGVAGVVDTQTGVCKNPRCKIDFQSLKVFIVYQSVVGSLNQIFFSSRNVSSGGIATAPVLLTETSGAINNLQNPDLYIADDYVLHVTWENSTATSILYQRFDSFGVPYDVAPSTVSTGVTRIGIGTLNNGATSPKIIVTNNMVPFVAFAQNKGAGLYGISIWSEGVAFMRDFFAPSENFTSYDFLIEDTHNDPILILGYAGNVKYAKLRDQAIQFTVSCASEDGTEVSIVKDKLGSAFLSWSNATNGVSFGKAPMENLVTAFSQEVLDSDILLARLAQPEGLILNWIEGGRPGSFYDMLLAHGSSVLIDWEVTAPGNFTFGSGLQILDMFSNVNYSLVAGSYPMAEGEAIYVILDGVITTVTPEVAPVSLIPWDQYAVVLGVIREGQFNPALMGVAGMVKLDSGEKIIFGQDLPQSLRLRLGIIDETTFQAYTSTIGCNSSDTYPAAISNVDIMAGQNRHLRPVRIFGSWGVDTASTFRLDNSCYVQIPGLPEARNEIPAGSYVLADGEVVYVSLNRTAGATAVLTLTVASAATLTLTRNTFILARRIGSNLAIDSLGKLYKPGEIIKEVVDEALKRVRVIDRVSSVLPTGASVTIDGEVLANGDRVLFANVALNKIYTLYGVGGAISWVASSEFEGSSVPSSKACIQVWDGAEVNKTIWTYDSVKGWYRISSYQDIVEVRAMDLTTTVLPTGALPLVVDGITILDGELVLFGNAALNQIYRVSGIGVAVAFEPMNLFRGLSAPQDGSQVLAQDGSVSDVMWEYDDDLSLWSAITLTYQNKQYLGLTSPSKSGGTYVDQLVAGQLNNVVVETDPLETAIKRLDVRSDVLNRVRVVDLINTSLPSGASCIIDGTLLANGDTVLFIRPSLNGIYKIAGVGSSITWTKLYSFGGSLVPSYYSMAYVAEGASTNRTIWISDATLNPPWRKYVDPDFLAGLATTLALHTLEINDLQDTLAGILANKPDMERFVAGPGGQSTFTLTRFTVDPLNSIFDIYVFWNGRWQNISVIGDFSDGQFRKNSSTEIELAETIPEGEEVTVYMWDPAAMFVRIIKVQKYTAVLGGQSLFTLDPLEFTVNSDNTVIDCEYCIDGRWQVQSRAGTFADGAVRKNSSTVIETAEPVTEGKEFVVIRRVPVGTAPGGSGGGGGGGSDVTNLTTDIGFATPHSVGTLLKPADSLFLKDQVTTDIWKLSVVSGVLQVVKVN